MTSSKTIRSRLLLIDTCVVIEAHRLDVWQALLSQWQVILPETVVGEAILVAREFDDFDLRLEHEIEEGLIQSPSLDASSLKIVMARCPPFPGKIDAGELECLAFLLEDADESSLICSSDAVVFRYLAWVQLSQRGISLEEVLRGIGLGLPLSFRLRKAFRKLWNQRGFAEAYQAGFIKP